MSHPLQWKYPQENAKLHRTYQIDAVDESHEIATYGRKLPENVIPTDVIITVVVFCHR